MKQRIYIAEILILFIMLLISGCWYQSNMHQLKHYQEYHDYASLKELSHYLKPGMTQAQAEKIVGTPDYSPAPGIYYYGSNSGRWGLILTYHKVGDIKDPSRIKITTLNQIILGEIME